MEVFGILFSIPVIFVGSLVYCSLAVKALDRKSKVFRWLYVAAVIVLLLFATEICLLVTLGPARAFDIIGPAFEYGHLLVFFLGAPSVATVTIVLIERSTCPKGFTIPASSAVCFVTGFGLILNQYYVFESNHGINGDDVRIHATALLKDGKLIG